MLPRIPPDPEAEPRHGYQLRTSGLQLVAKYANMPLPEVQELDILDYLTLRRDAFIQALSGTSHGQEALEKAWLWEQTKADRAALREIVGRK